MLYMKWRRGLTVVYGRCDEDLRYGRWGKDLRYGRCDKDLRYGRCGKDLRYGRWGKDLRIVFGRCEQGFAIVYGRWVGSYAWSMGGEDKDLQ